MEQLIKEIKKTGNDGAVMFKLVEGRVTHISPLLQVQDIQQMYSQLSSVRDAIQALLNDLVNKGLISKGQGN